MRKPTICIGENKDLSCVPWDILEHFDNIDDIVSIWNSLFLEIFDKHAPIKCHRVKSKFQPEWLTPEILDCMKDRINAN